MTQGPDPSYTVLDFRPCSRLAETGICRIVGKQREPENKGERTKYVKGSFA
jgi:hypothetical protein